jgi:hypothetical protein
MRSLPQVHTIRRAISNELGTDRGHCNNPRLRFALADGLRARNVNGAA